MKGAWFSLCLCGALCFAPVASGQSVEKGAADRCSAKPAYLCFDKRVLWGTAERWRAKHDRVEAQLRIEEREHLGTLKKLQARTSTAVAALVVPPLPVEPDGHSNTTLILAGLAALAVGVIVGVAVAKKDPQTIVVR